MHVVDSAVTDQNGHFIFHLTQGAMVGLYRVTWGKEKQIDMIWNREMIKFSTISEYPLDSLKFETSVENHIYYFYLSEDHMTQQKLDLLIPILDYYPVKDDYYSHTVTEFEAIQKRLQKLQDSISVLYPGSFAIRIIKNQATPFLPPNLSKEERIQYLRVHFFDHVNFQDTLLLNSNVWANKSISYLSLYGNSKLDQKQLEGEFIKAVTAMLSAAAVNAEVYKFMQEHLSENRRRKLQGSGDGSEGDS